MPRLGRPSGSLELELGMPDHATDGAARIRALFSSDEVCARAPTLSVDEAAAEVERLIARDGTTPSIAEATEALYASARAQADEFEGGLAGYVARVRAELDSELELAARQAKFIGISSYTAVATRR